MRTIEELKQLASEALVKIREKTKTSKSRMADILGVDRRTYNAFEDPAADAEPTLSQWITLFETFGMSAYRMFLE